MAEYTKETVTTEGDETVQPKNTPKRESTGTQTVQYVVYWVLGVLEVLLAFRLVLRLLGANPSSVFVDWIYALSGVFIWPFQGIFPSPATDGAVTTAVLEPATIIAMAAYAFLAWGIAKLISISAGERQE
jgi:hypothetical protein